MRALSTVLSAVADALAPDTTTAKLTWQARLDRIVTLGIAVLAVAATLAYQAYARWVPRTNARD